MATDTIRLAALGRNLASALLAVLLAACAPTGLLTPGTYAGAPMVATDIDYALGPRHALDIYTAQQPLPGKPVVVFFYGGRWETGSREQYRFVGERLSRQGVTVVIPDYRLAPDVAYPSFIEDGAAAVAWTRAHIADYGGNPGNIFIMGHSAGAYIAAELALDKGWLQAVGIEPSSLSGMVGLAGPYNFAPVTDDDLKPVFANGGDEAATQPINHVDGRNPPLLLLAGAVDTTVDPRKNTLALFHAVTARGGAASARFYADTGHIGVLLDMSPLFEEEAPVIFDVMAFIHAYSKP